MHSSVSGVYFLVPGRTISKLKKAAHKNSQLALSWSAVRGREQSAVRANPLELYSPVDRRASEHS